MRAYLPNRKHQVSPAAEGRVIEYPPIGRRISGRSRPHAAITGSYRKPGHRRAIRPWFVGEQGNPPTTVGPWCEAASGPGWYMVRAAVNMASAQLALPSLPSTRGQIHRRKDPYAGISGKPINRRFISLHRLAQRSTEPCIQWKPWWCCRATYTQDRHGQVREGNIAQLTPTRATIFHFRAQCGPRGVVLGSGASAYAREPGKHTA